MPDYTAPAVQGILRDQEVWLRIRDVGLRLRSLAQRLGVSRRPATLVAVVIALALLAACSGDEPAQTPAVSGPGAGVAAPAVTVLPPTPAPTPTPTFIPVGLPLPPTATPRPVATPDPNAPTATPQTLAELFPLIEEQIPTPRFNHQSLTLDDGRILFVAGTLPSLANNGLILGGPHPFIEVYDPGSGDWSLGEFFDPPLVFLNAVQLDNGNVLILGIEQAESAEQSLPVAAYIMDWETLAISRVSQPVAARASPDLVLIDDGRVAAIGGIDVLSESSIFDVPVSLAVEIYDPALDTWIDASPQPGGIDREFNFWEQSDKSQWVFPMPGSRILTFRVGEIAGDEDSFNEDFGRIDLFDATTDTWESLATIPLGFSDQPWHATVSASGVLNILYTDRIESFNPSTGEWSISYPPDSVILEDPEAEESFTFERHALPRSATITELPDGCFLVAGGERGGYSTLPRSATILYDPETKIWALGPELAEPRVQHSATVLDDGSVLLFGGATIWEENEREGAPTNTVEIIPAEVLAAVDTVTLLATHSETPDGPVDYPCWNLASVAAPLPIVSDDPGELPDVRQLLADSLVAMNAAESFALTSLWLNYEGEPEQHIMDSRNSRCSSHSYTYQAPDRVREESLGFQNRSFNGRSISVTADQTHYGYSQGEDAWRVLGYVQDEELRGTDEALSQETLDDLTITWTALAIEELNGEEVYHLHGNGSESETLTVAEYDYWIGVEDHLIRRVFRYIGAPGYNEPEKRRQTYELVEVGRFGEVFNIQPPLTPEEAARPEASGSITCRSIKNLEPLPQAVAGSRTSLDSAFDIIDRSTQVMNELTSYATLDLRYGYARSKDSENLVRIGGDCLYAQIDVEEPNRLSSREILFRYGEIEDDVFRIIVGQDEYSRESIEGDWTRQEYDSSQPFPWSHAQFLGPDAIEPEFSLEIEGVESLDGVDVYHIAGRLTGAGEEGEKTLSMWIGVDDLLLRRISVVTRVEDLEQTFIGL